MGKMIKSRNYMPDYITEKSRDIHTFLRLIDLVANNSKLQSDDFINILNPSKCPNNLLPLLSSYLGYDYDYTETYDGNRIILQAFKSMIKNKGSSVGIRLAVSCAISMTIDKSIVDAQSLFNVSYYDEYYICNNCNHIEYSEFNVCPICSHNDISKSDKGSIIIVIEYPIYSHKVYDLVELVRPAGTSLGMYSGSLVEHEDTIGIQEFVNIQSKYYNLGDAEIGGIDTKSGQTVIPKEFPINTYYCEFCGNLFVQDSGTITCTHCGTSGNAIKKYNDSNLRLLYRLYNTNNELKSTVNTIISDISNNDTINNSDIVGVILRVHIDNKENDTEKQWADINEFTQSFVFGVKPFIAIGSNNYFEYSINDILDKIYNINKNKEINIDNKNNNYTYTIIKDENNNYCIQVKSVNGNIINTYNYVISNNFNVFAFHDFLNTNGVLPSATVNGVSLYQGETSDEFNGNIPNANPDTETYEGEVLTPTPENPITLQPYPVNYRKYSNIKISDNPEFDFHIGKDNEYFKTIEIGSNLSIVEQSVEYNSSDEGDRIVNDNKTVINQTDYFKVCNNCNSLSVEKDNDICNHCGNSGTTLLSGSYVIDLYFGNNWGE